MSLNTLEVHIPSPMDGFAVLDVETTIAKDSTFPNKASPFIKENKLVAVGSEKGGIDVVTTLVGCNLPFDYNWLRREALVFRHPFRFWDVQLAEYLLSGQQTSFASLDFLSAKYGGTLKDNKVYDEYFSKGLGADHVPEAMLHEYLENDLKNTRIIFDKQFVEVAKQGMMPLVLSQMEALAATTEMQWNGMKLDTALVNTFILNYTKAIATIEEALEVYREEFIPQDKEFSFLSNKQLLTFLCGGEHHFTKRNQIGVYKTGAKMGQPRFSIDKHTINLPSQILVAKVDDAALQDAMGDLRVSSKGAVLHLIELVLEHRKISKQLSTYFEGHLKCVTSAGFVHPQHNHTVTRTGRLSSSGPNMQNVTSDGEIKRCYVSRWGKDGVLMEADYNQLEMVMLAHLSQDEQLIEDLDSGKDMHSELYNEMHGHYPTKDERKPFKRLSFGLVYGAGANTLAENAGVDVVVAKLFIKTFYSRYSGVKAWHEGLLDIARRGRVTGTTKTKLGYPAGEYVEVSETGRRFAYHEYDAPDFVKARTGSNTGFSPTELKNYPVQGGATGDIVPLVLGKLHRAIQQLAIDLPASKGMILLVNTVHDSVLLDVHNDWKAQAAQLVKQVMEEAPDYYLGTFGKPFNLKLKVNVTTGLNWLDQEEYL